MYKHLLKNYRPSIAILIATVIGVLALFWLESHQGLSFLDEGYLWYGAQRVRVGEVPMRDFMSYDIGRYYWTAAFMSLLDDNGIVALRGAIAIFQAIAIFIALLLLARRPAKHNPYFLLVAAIALVAWMAPQCRLFENSLPIMLIGILSLLVEQPSIRRYFLAGVIVGLAAVFGRNHGIYGVVGSLCTLFYLQIKRESSPKLTTAFATWSLGVIIGYLPVLVFIAVVPGFASAFWESIRLLFEVKATNFPLPIPWPWLVPFGKLSITGMLRGVLQGIFFVTIILFAVLGIVWLIWQRLHSKPVSSTLAASVFMALPYAHYAFSRADIPHLATSIAPVLIGIFALLANLPAKIKWPFATLLCGASVLLMLPAHPAWTCYSSQKCVDIEVVGDILKVDRETATNLAALKKLADRFAPGDRTFIATPFWPGAYAALERKSPMWGTYISLFPPTVASQQAEIERIKTAKPGFALIDDRFLDKRDDLRFRNTHPLVDQYIRDHFVPLEWRSWNASFRIYRNMQDGGLEE